MKKVILFSLSILLIPSLLVGIKKEQVIEKDNVIYDQPITYKFDKPKFASDSSEVYAKKVTIHYHNDDGQNSNREFYVWGDNVPAYYLAPTVTNAGVDMSITIDFVNDSRFTPFLEETTLKFIVKRKGTWDGQTADIILSYSEFPPDENGFVEVWTIPSEGNMLGIYKSEEETKFDKINLAKWMDWKTLHCVATMEPTSYSVYSFDRNYYEKTPTDQEIDKPFYLLKSGSPTGGKKTDKGFEFDIVFNHSARVNIVYQIESTFSTKPEITQMCKASFEYLYVDERFEKFYTYDGNDLGATYSKEKTTFKVWSPTSASAVLKVYNTGTPKYLSVEHATGSNYCKEYPMRFLEGGIWSATIEGDLAGKYYTYLLNNANGEIETIDPYAKACGINGIRGAILDFSLTNPNGWDDLPHRFDGTSYDIKSPQELSIYEVHIRDLTSDETWSSNNNIRRGTYSAFMEKGTSLTTKDIKENSVTVTTGFDHIEEMGVNAIQLVPVFDNDNNETMTSNEDGSISSNYRFNWGYNPLNYNCIDGGYASDPYNASSRVEEFKSMILAYGNNKNNTRVIMDVVYNHVSSASNHSFNKVMPKYFFRYDEEWNFLAGSGCANEVKTESKMGRKYIVDSVCWWAEEFKIKGFRFDLMGLIDVGTMKAVKEALFEIDPDIYCYGEGWTAAGWGGDDHNRLVDMPGTFTDKVYSELYDSSSSRGWVGAFNDEGRKIKGENSKDYDSFYGFIGRGDNGHLVKDMLLGYHTGKGGNPAQCVNYASCHDNYTLFDQLSYTIGSDGNNNMGPYYPGIVCAGIASLEVAILMSNGVAFIQGGEELFRSKEVKSESDKALITMEDENGNTYLKDTETILGKTISHNSYNLSDEVNSFKWDRKVKIDSTDTRGYVKAIVDAVHIRKEMEYYTYQDMEGWSDLPNDQRPMNCWDDDGSKVIGMKRGDYFFFINSISDSYLSFGALESMNLLINSNPYGEGYVAGEKDGYAAIKLGWATSVVFKSK